MEFVYTHLRKNNVLDVIKTFLNMVKTRYNQTVQFIHIDDEPTLGAKFDELLQNEGITQERTAPYIPDQNGQTERSGGVVILRAKALRISSRLPANLWSEIYKAVSYINNRTPRKSLGWKTPFEVLHGKKPSLSHFHFYGCRAYPLRFKIPRKDKLEFRALIGYFVGYDLMNIFRI